MRIAKILFFALMLPASALGQQQASADCDNNLASTPGEPGKEYNLFKNLAARARGCTSPSSVTYEKVDGQKAYAPSGSSRSATPQQEELDRAACRAEGENAAKSAHGLQPGEYDIFKSFAANQSGEVEKVEQNCMDQRGYKKVQN